MTGYGRLTDVQYTGRTTCNQPSRDKQTGQAIIIDHGTGAGRPVNFTSNVNANSSDGRRAGVHIIGLASRRALHDQRVLLWRKSSR